MSALAAAAGAILTSISIGFRMWPMLAGYFFVMAICTQIRELREKGDGKR